MIGKTCVVQNYSSIDDNCAYCPPVFENLTITLSIIGTLMTNENLDKYNPIKINILKLSHMPGISANPLVETQTKFLENGPYDDMNDLCNPVYISFKFFNCKRIAKSPGFSSCEKINMNYETVFLTGEIPKY